ncbi:hypothetical protein E2C01_093749 [Portunus trituberculatus]|uniref:Uncharacterized protein n=1 Tax=Portunus trituberculatus TaxID=210409 RepID=A0A5B7JNI7_PORTR|nr:hypothetical protein [Portunus trituberculatus]
MKMCRSHSVSSLKQNIFRPKSLRHQMLNLVLCHLQVLTWIFYHVIDA